MIAYYDEMPITTRLAMNCLDGGITFKEYSLIAEQSAFSRQQMMTENVLTSKVMDYVADAVQVLGGAGLVVGSGGMGGDTITDSLVAVQSSTSLMDTVSAIMSGGGIITGFVDGIQNLTFAGSFEAIYRSVQDLMLSISATSKSASGFFDRLRKQIVDLIGKVMRAAEKYISTLIPDDAGTIGIGIRKVILAGLDLAMGSAYDLLTGLIKKLPNYVMSMIFDVNAIAGFLRKTMGKLVSVLKDMKAGKSLESAIVDDDDKKDKGFMDKLGNFAKKAAIKGGKYAARGVAAAATMGASELMIGAASMIPDSLLKNPLLSTSISFIKKYIIPNIPLASKLFVWVWKILFGGLAALQIIASGDYKTSPAESSLDIDLKGVMPGKGAAKSLEQALSENTEVYSTTLSLRQSSIQKIIKECTAPGKHFYDANSLLRYYG